MSTPADQMKSAAATAATAATAESAARSAVSGEVASLKARVNFLEGEIETALGAHRWYLIAGFVLGAALGVILGHLL